MNVIVVVALAVAAADGAEINGYLSERLQATLPSAAALSSTADLPILFSLTELSALGRLRLLDDRLTILVDASAFLTAQGGYADRAPDGTALESVDDHDVPADPRLVFSEAYIRLQPIDHLDITVGKRRVVWGTGMAFNPTDVLNPPRDPTDASLQRAGIPMVLVEAPFEGFGLSALFAPSVLEERSGIPATMLMWPDVVPRETLQNPTLNPDPRDDVLHFAAAVKGSAFVADTDVGVWVTLLQGYGQDPRQASPRFSMALSRIFFEIHELHFEGMWQAGSDRFSANSDCVDAGADVDDNTAAVAACAFAGIAPLERARLDDGDALPRFLFGSRSMFGSGATLGIEWLYQADGLMPDALAEVLALQTVVGEGARAGAPLPGGLFGQSGVDPNAGGAPARLAVTPLRRHHVVVSYSHPNVMDDFTLMGTALIAAEDLSAIWTGSVSWQTTEWLTLSAWAFVPTPSLPRALDAMGADFAKDILWPAVVDGELYGEFDVAPFSGRVMFEARAFF
jgi:hypothetical protein